MSTAKNRAFNSNSRADLLSNPSFGAANTGSSADSSSGTVHCSRDISQRDVRGTYAF